MKKLFIKFLTAILLVTICQSISFGQNTAQLSKRNYERAEQSYLNGLESNNFGMRANSAYYLGELKSQAAVFHLINMIYRDRNYGCRIVAALSLFKIGDAAGIQAVKNIREYTPDDKSTDDNYISHLSVLWNQYLQKNPDEAVALKNIQFPSEAS
jgi:HEAT repeat protein